MSACACTDDYRCANHSFYPLPGGGIGVRPQDELAKVMINRRNPRVVATGCLGCGLSLIACQSRGEFESDRCCSECCHD